MAKKMKQTDEELDSAPSAEDEGAPVSADEADEDEEQDEADRAEVDDEDSDEDEESEDDEPDDEGELDEDEDERTRSVTLYRTVTIRATRAEDESDARIPITMSSQEPVERFDIWSGRSWFEVLEHSDEAVDLSYTPLPFLVDHDTREQVGVVEDVKVKAGKLRGFIRFSRSQRAQEIKQDILDGIRTRCSIGYRVRSLQLEEADEERGDTFRATRWTVLESSVVPIPADIHGSGIGRSALALRRESDGTAVPVRSSLRASKAQREDGAHSHKNRPQMARSITVSDTNTVAQNGAAEDRATSILNLAREHNLESRAGEWIVSGASVEDVMKTILAETRRNQAKVTASGGAYVDLTEKEQRTFSFLRAINAAAEKDWRRAGLEREVSEAIEKALPSGYRRQSTNSFFLPMSVRAPLTVTTAASAGNLVFTEQGAPFIDILRNKMKVRELGATVLTGLEGPVEFTKQTGTGSVQWLGESGTVTESNLTVGRVALSPRTIRAKQSLTKQLIRQSNSVDAEMLVRNDLANDMALEIDRAALHGTGAANQPLGLASQAGVNVVAIGANGGALTYDHLIEMEKEIAIDNAEASAMHFLSSPEVRAKYRKMAPLGATTGEPVWRGGFTGELYAYPAHVSNQIAKNLVKGTSTDCHAVFFGAWNNLYIGEWGVLEVEVDPYTRADQGEVVIRTFHMVGIAVRYPEAFSVILDARPQL